MRRAAAFFAALLCAAFSACGSGGGFDGSANVSDGGYFLDFDLLDRCEYAYLALSEGESLAVELACAEGYVSVAVGLDGEEPIYEGSWIENARFTLNIHAGGDYRVSVIGHDARGSAVFSVIRAEG